MWSIDPVVCERMLPKNKHTTSRNLDLGALYNLRIEYLLKSSLEKDLPKNNVDEQIFSLEIIAFK